MQDISLPSFIQIAARLNNNKRPYLLVNTLQAKHVPVKPCVALNMFTALGNIIRSKYPNSRLVIGFAETATAIGFEVARCLGNNCAYLTTTREPFISDADCICFKEEHSHAVEQKLYVKNFDKLLADTEEVILVDDEISTGKTLLNIIQELRNYFPELRQHRVVVASLLNRITSEQERVFNESNIFFESLCRYSGAIPDVPATILSSPKPLAFEANSHTYQSNLFSFPDPRRSVLVGDYITACDSLVRIIGPQLNLSSRQEMDMYAPNLLVLGTEECMYPSIYLAQKLEQTYFVNAYCHSTTRSPICKGTVAEYPIKSGYTLPSLYDEDRITYLYNLKPYDMAIIISDSQQPTPKAISALDSLLNSYHVAERFYYFGGEMI